MKNVQITTYKDLEELVENGEGEFIVDLENCDNKTKMRALDFLAGFACKNGKLTKLNKNEFMVSSERRK